MEGGYAVVANYDASDFFRFAYGRHGEDLAILLEWAGEGDASWYLRLANSRHKPDLAQATVDGLVGYLRAEVGDLLPGFLERERRLLADYTNPFTGNIDSQAEFYRRSPRFLLMAVLRPILIEQYQNLTLESVDALNLLNNMSGRMPRGYLRNTFEQDQDSDDASESVQKALAICLRIEEVARELGYGHICDDNAVTGVDWDRQYMSELFEVYKRMRTEGYAHRDLVC